MGTFIAKLARDFAVGQFESNMRARADELRRILYELGCVMAELKMLVGTKGSLVFVVQWTKNSPPWLRAEL